MHRKQALSFASLVSEEDPSYLNSPERKLHFEILLRAYEDAVLPCNKAHKVSALNWFKQVTVDPFISFKDVCHSLELSTYAIETVLKKVLDADKLQTKRKPWRTRVG